MYALVDGVLELKILSKLSKQPNSYNCLSISQHQLLLQSPPLLLLDLLCISVNKDQDSGYEDNL